MVGPCNVILLYISCLMIIWDVVFTCTRKVLFISGNGSEKGQHIALLKMALMGKMVSITAWQYWKL